MSVKMVSIGSPYARISRDAKGNPLVGVKTYKLRMPACARSIRRRSCHGRAQIRPSFFNATITGLAKPSVAARMSFDSIVRVVPDHTGCGLAATNSVVSATM